MTSWRTGTMIPPGVSVKFRNGNCSVSGASPLREGKIHTLIRPIHHQGGLVLDGLGHQKVTCWTLSRNGVLSSSNPHMRIGYHLKEHRILCWCPFFVNSVEEALIADDDQDMVYSPDILWTKALRLDHQSSITFLLVMGNAAAFIKKYGVLSFEVSVFRGCVLDILADQPRLSRVSARFGLIRARAIWGKRVTCIGEDATIVIRRVFAKKTWIIHQKGGTVKISFFHELVT